MAEQGAVLFLNEDDGMWELATGKPGIRIMWRNEDDALRDRASEGWKIEGPFRMGPKKPGFRNLWFTGYGLSTIWRVSWRSGKRRRTSPESG